MAWSIILSCIYMFTFWSRKTFPIDLTLWEKSQLFLSSQNLQGHRFYQFKSIYETISIVGNVNSSVISSFKSMNINAFIYLPWSPLKSTLSRAASLLKTLVTLCHFLFKTLYYSDFLSLSRVMNKVLTVTKTPHDLTHYTDLPTSSLSLPLPLQPFSPLPTPFCFSPTGLLTASPKFQSHSCFWTFLSLPFILPTALLLTPSIPAGVWLTCNLGQLCLTRPPKQQLALLPSLLLDS